MDEIKSLKQLFNNKVLRRHNYQSEILGKLKYEAFEIELFWNYWQEKNDLRSLTHKKFIKKYVKRVSKNCQIV